MAASLLGVVWSRNGRPLCRGVISRPRRTASIRLSFGRREGNVGVQWCFQVGWSRTEGEAMIHAVAVLAAVVASAPPARRRVLRAEGRPGAGRGLRPVPRAEEGVGRAQARLARGDAHGAARTARRSPREARGKPARPGGPPRRRRRLADAPRQGPPARRRSTDLAALGRRRGALAGEGRPTIRAARHWAFEPVRAVDPPARAPAATPIDAFLAARTAEEGAHARRSGRQADADPPRDVRPDRPAADARGGRRVPRRRRRPTRSRRWSTGCSPRPRTASGGAGTGSTSSATPTPTG